MEEREGLRRGNVELHDRFSQDSDSKPYTPADHGKKTNGS